MKHAIAALEAAATELTGLSRIISDPSEVPFSPPDAVDQLAALKAQIDALKSSEESLKARLIEWATMNQRDEVIGTEHRAKISHRMRESQDDTLKAKIQELIDENLSRQFIVAHTRTSEWDEVRLYARKSSSR
ncbi:MAG: DUF5320 domain-containing protein [Patescibacteria group bacterium]|nr:DUF5320 domain-containing protein [Patescibacteria group bacterium]